MIKKIVDYMVKERNKQRGGVKIMKLIAKSSEDLYLIRLENATCMVDKKTDRILQKEWR